MKKKGSQISLIDMDTMHTVFGKNQAAILEYLVSFVEITSKLLNNIEHAIQEKNETVLTDYFHQLKGSVGSIGFKKMTKLCEKTEEKITQSDWVSAGQLCREMEQILKQLQVELKN